MILSTVAPSRSVLLSALLLLAACDGPTAPSPRLVVEAVEGKAQEGLPGELLPADLGVRVTRADGSPAVGAVVHFRAADGAGTVQLLSEPADVFGMVRANWRLPLQPGGALAVTATVEGAAEPARFTAGWLPRERADLLLTNAPGAVRLLLHSAGVMTVTGAFQASFRDSLAFAPFAGRGDFDEAVAFADGLPPAVRQNVRWTAGRDTLRLDFAPRVQVPLTFWIVAGPYDVVRGRMEMQLMGAGTTWGRAGIEFPDVRWVDATAHPRAGEFQGETQACGPAQGVGMDEDRTNIYVTGPLVKDGFAYSGYACSPGMIFMTSASAHSGLLAHELGHTFDLNHRVTGNNVMDPYVDSFDLTDGQIFRAHASAGSAIHLLYAGRAVVPVRACLDRQPTCLDAGFDM
jgi:hypothetical protein